MNLYSISIKSLMRRKSRSIFLIASLVLAISSIVSLVLISKDMSKSITRDLDDYGANILISPGSDELSLSYGGVSIGDVKYSDKRLFNEDLNKIQTIKNKKNISVIAPKLFSVEMIDTFKAIVAGVSFEEEFKIKKWWKINGSKPSSQTDVILGIDTHKKLGLNIGDSLLLRNKRFQVSGIIQPTGSQDDAIIFIDLSLAQKIFDTNNELSLIEVSALCYDCPIEEIVAQTQEKLPKAKVIAIKQSIDTKMAAITKFENFSLGISSIILIISMMIVFANVNSSVSDRVREIGVFIAVGFRRAHVFRLIMFEVLVATIIAGVIGFFIGSLIPYFLAPWLGSNSEVELFISFPILLFSVSLSIIVGLISAIYPAYQATKLDPTVSFRTYY